MDCSNATTDVFWEWKEEDYSLHMHLGNDMPCFLWDEVKQNECGLMYVLDEQTPIRECTESGHHVFNNRVEFDPENTNKASEDCKELSLLKRRRMLQYDINNADKTISNEQSSSLSVHSKVKEEPHSEDGLNESMLWVHGFPGDGCFISHEAMDQLSEGCLTHCCGDIDMNIWCSEMISSEAFEGQIDLSDYCDNRSDIEPDKVLNETMPSPLIKFKGRKSGTNDTMSMSTSVAYPFALVKPSGVQGDTTLNDINQRIHSPSPSNTQHMNDGDPWLCFSAISGKPVVAKTKIRTEGGKGSIIITRTKG